MKFDKRKNNSLDLLEKALNNLNKLISEHGFYKENIKLFFLPYLENSKFKILRIGDKVKITLEDYTQKELKIIKINKNNKSIVCERL